MSDSFTSALLDALNASVELMLETEPTSKQRMADRIGLDNSQSQTGREALDAASNGALPLQQGQENRFATIVGFGMAKIRAGQEA